MLSIIIVFVFIYKHRTYVYKPYVTFAFLNKLMIKNRRWSFIHYLTRKGILWVTFIKIYLVLFFTQIIIITGV